MQTRRTNLSLLFALTFGVGLLLQGCMSASRYDNCAPSLRALAGHQYPLVKYPTEVGFYSGVAASIPVGIAIGLVAIPTVATLGDDGKQNWDQLNEFSIKLALYMGHAAGYALGGPCWLLLGCWFQEMPLNEVGKSESVHDEVHSEMLKKMEDHQ